MLSIPTYLCVCVFLFSHSFTFCTNPCTCNHHHHLKSGYLDVVVPPDILNHPEQNLEEGMCNEGGTIMLICSAIGVPEPTVQWRREGAKDIVLRTESREKQGKTMHECKN